MVLCDRQPLAAQVLRHAYAKAARAAMARQRGRFAGVRSEQVDVGCMDMDDDAHVVRHRHVVTYAMGDSLSTFQEHFEQQGAGAGRNLWRFDIMPEHLLLKQHDRADTSVVYVALQLPVPLGRNSPAAQSSLGGFPVWDWPHISLLYNAEMPRDTTGQWQTFWMIKHICMLHLRGPTSFLVECEGQRRLRLSPVCQLFTQLKHVRTELVVGMNLREEDNHWCDRATWDDFHITWCGRDA